MNTIEKKSLKVGKYVNTEHVDGLIRNYKTERWIHNSERMGTNDTLGVWYTIDELEEFIQTARMQGADGIRLYFGVYGDNAPRPGSQGKQTIALVATHTELASDGKEVRKDLYINSGEQKTLLAYNAGFPIPDVPGGGSGTSVLTLGLTITVNKDNQMVII